MVQRIVSRIDAEGLLTVAVDEINGTDLDKYFEENPRMRSVTGVPRYWSEKYGYWPIPDKGWKCSVSLK